MSADQQFSPRLMSSDLGLDPSDPLNLLLHNTSQSNDSFMEDSQSEDASPPDWSELTALWQDNLIDQSASVTMKPFPDVMDFSSLASLSMDMDYNPNMSVEPSALHFDPTKLHYNYQNSSPFQNETNPLSAHFPFSFHTPLDKDKNTLPIPPDSSKIHNHSRRLSITSSSSSTGPSYSPVSESIPSPATGYNSDAHQPVQHIDNQPVKDFFNDPAAELANRVRQSAGVMLALPVSGQGQNLDLLRVNTMQAKLPIPRLPRHTMKPDSKASSPSASSAASTPPPSTPPLSSMSTSQRDADSSTISASTSETSDAAAITSSRPKTSHTTIERRYRTNLNARIQSLRMAVPALRVLEDREGNGKKIKKNVKGGVIIKGLGMVAEVDDGSVDVIDERGFVDGVKVARKCSKANVLGKAVEYIRVLKKRENRLKAEQAGLKTLISGLVGGPALLKEWEREWREQFGGEEKDEVEGELGADGDVDDDDSDDDEDEEEAGRKRKRGKVTASSKKEKLTDKQVVHIQTASENGSTVVPEKRKRGRPRKVAPLPVPTVTAMQQGHVHIQTTPSWPQGSQQQDSKREQPQQYLLAVFALFSFFNSPLNSSPSPVTPHRHTGTILNPPMVYSPEIMSQFTTPVTTSSQLVDNSWGLNGYIQAFHLLVSALVLWSFLSRKLGLGSGILKGRSILSFFTLELKNTDINRNVNWLTEGEASVIRGTPCSLYTSFQIYRSVSSRKDSSIRDLSSLAIILFNAASSFGGLAHFKARTIWDAAKSQMEMTHRRLGQTLKVKLFEKLVLNEMDVSDAADRLKIALPQDKTDGQRAYAPIEVLGAMLIRERVQQHLGDLFTNLVLQASEDVETIEKRELNAVMQETVDAAKELGGHIEELGRLFERLWKTPTAVSMHDIRTGNVGTSEEITAQLTALILYRTLFASRLRNGSGPLLSPPPSPIHKDTKVNSDTMLELRKVLGNRVFEDETGGGIEDARDQVVDMIVEYERLGRCRIESL